MNRYRIRISVDGKRKLYYIEDQENYDIVLLPSKYLKHKADANRSPNTVRRLALSICYYLNYLDQTGTELLQVAKKSFEEQSSHFGQFLKIFGQQSDGLFVRFVQAFFLQQSVQFVQLHVHVAGAGTDIEIPFR